MNRKIVGLIALLLCTVLLLTACGGRETPASDEKKDAAAAGRERVVIYTAAEDERIAYLQEALDKKFPGTESCCRGCRRKERPATAIFSMILRL